MQKIIGILVCMLLIAAAVPAVESFKNSAINSTFPSYPLTSMTGNWTQMQKLLASDGATSDIFGRSVSIDGGTALIGEVNDDGKGSAYVFTRTGNTWTQQQKLLASEGAANDQFGRSVSIYGDTALIGALGDDGWKGSAYVFTRSGTTWTQQAKLLASDGEAYDIFGISVSIYGDTALIGASYDDDNGDDSGSAFVFIRTGTTWTQQQKLTASDGAANDYFGFSVSLDGDIALIGAPYDDDNGVDSGSAYVFTRFGTTWTQQAKLLASDGASGDDFGYSVSLSGETALIGANNDDGWKGSAYVFTRTGNTWPQQAKLLASDGATGDDFGCSVSLSGETALIGAYIDDNYRGSAYLFTRTGNTWTQQQKLLASDGAASDSFGHSVSLSGETALIGAPLDDDNGDNSGSVYVFIGPAPPSSPTIDGPTRGKPNIAYQWNFTSIDPNNDDVFYQIDWSDGTVSEWYGPYHSGEPMSQSHSYHDKGTYTIKARAKDIYGAESDWGYLEVSIPRTHTPFILRLLEQFPHAFPILRHLMGL